MNRELLLRLRRAVPKLDYTAVLFTLTITITKIAK